MADEQHVLISVRGEAERVVTPDAARLSTSVSAIAGSKAEALALVGQAITRLTSPLEELGGQALDVHTARDPLTWSTHNIRSNKEWDHSDGTPRHTGRHECSAQVAITIRDLGLLDRVSQGLATDDEVGLRSVSWAVDDDNPQWAQVRADAIRAALLKTRDYAGALGGAVVRVEHVTDGGLLGRESFSRASEQSRRVSGLSFAGHGDDSDTVSLEPVPQTITAIIEARVTATVGPLPT